MKTLAIGTSVLLNERSPKIREVSQARAVGCLHFFKSHLDSAFQQAENGAEMNVSAPCEGSDVIVVTYPTEKHLISFFGL